MPWYCCLLVSGYYCHNSDDIFDLMHGRFEAGPTKNCMATTDIPMLVGGYQHFGAIWFPWIHTAAYAKDLYTVTMERRKEGNNTREQPCWCKTKTWPLLQVQRCLLHFVTRRSSCTIIGATEQGGGSLGS